MANATTPLTTMRAEFSGEMKQFIVKNSTAVYVGRYAALDASAGVTTGYVTNPADTAGVVMLGFIVAPGEGGWLDGGGQSTTITGNTSATVPPRVMVDVGGGVVSRIAVTGASTQAHVGRKVYLSTNNITDLTLTPTTNIPAVGVIEEFYSATSFDVRFFSMMEMAGEV